MSPESRRCRVLGGKVPIIIIGGMFFCFGSLITVASIFATIKAAPHVFPFVMFVFIGGLGGGIGHIMLTRMPYETVSNDKGMKMAFLFRNEWVSWDKMEWYKNVAWRQSFQSCTNIWVLLKYQVVRNDKKCLRKALLLLPSVGSHLGWSSKGYITMLDQYIPHKSKNNKHPKKEIIVTH